MERAAEATGESAFLGVLTRDWHVHYVSKAVSRNEVRYDADLEYLRPAYCASLGLTIIAHRPGIDAGPWRDVAAGLRPRARSGIQIQWTHGDKGATGMSVYDVIVVGAGNAACAAAVSARQSGAKRVLILEKAPVELRGGNTHYSGAAFRIAFNSAEDLRPLVPDAEKHEPGFFENVVPYPADQFWADLRKVTENRTDPRLAAIMIDNSYSTVPWMKDSGIQMEPAVMLGAVKYGGKTKFLSGTVIRAVEEGV